MRDLTDRPFGVNIAQAFVRDPAIAEFVIDQGVKFVTTSAGSPDEVHRRAQGGRTHRVPRRPDACCGHEGRRRRRRRARRRRRRGRRLQEPDTGVDDGAPAAGALEGRRADHRRWRHHRRCDDGRSLRARRRGRPDGHPHGVRRRVAGARELEAGDPRRRRDRHAVPQPAPLPRTSGAAHRADRRRSSTPSTTCSATSATHRISTSAAT